MTRRRKNSSKLSGDFYLKLLLIFLITFALCSIGLFFEYQYLIKYEASTPVSAANRLLKRGFNKDYQAIYDEAIKFNPQYNSEEDFKWYVENLFNSMDQNSIYTSEDLSCAATGDTSCFVVKNKLNESVSTIFVKKVDDEYVATLTTYKNEFTIISQNSSLDLYLNGLIIDKSEYLQDEESYFLAYDNLNNTSNLNTYQTYKILQIISDNPQISVSDSNYQAVQDGINDYIYVGLKPTADQKEIYNQLLEKVAKTYCMYITEDTSLWSLQSLLYRYSTFYNEISTFENIYFTTHDSIEFDNIQIKDVINLGDDGFIGTISFDYVVTSGDNVKTYNSTYQLTFINSYNNYLCSNITTLSSDNQ